MPRLGSGLLETVRITVSRRGTSAGRPEHPAVRHRFVLPAIEKGFERRIGPTMRMW